MNATMLRLMDEGGDINVPDEMEFERRPKLLTRRQYKEMHKREGYNCKVGHLVPMEQRGLLERGIHKAGQWLRGVGRRIVDFFRSLVGRKPKRKQLRVPRGTTRAMRRKMLCLPDPNVIEVEFTEVAEAVEVPKPSVEEIRVLAQLHKLVKA